MADRFLAAGLPCRPRPRPGCGAARLWRSGAAGRIPAAHQPLCGAAACRGRGLRRLPPGDVGRPFSRTPLPHRYLRTRAARRRARAPCRGWARRWPAWSCLTRSARRCRRRAPWLWCWRQPRRCTFQSRGGPCRAREGAVRLRKTAVQLKICSPLVALLQQTTQLILFFFSVTHPSSRLQPALRERPPR